VGPSHEDAAEPVAITHLDAIIVPLALVAAAIKVVVHTKSVALAVDPAIHTLQREQKNACARMIVRPLIKK
jgi:hypothetical protein